VFIFSEKNQAEKSLISLQYTIQLNSAVHFLAFKKQTLVDLHCKFTNIFEDIGKQNLSVLVKKDSGDLEEVKRTRKRRKICLK